MQRVSEIQAQIQFYELAPYPLQQNKFSHEPWPPFPLSPKFWKKDVQPELATSFRALWKTKTYLALNISQHLQVF